MTNSTNLVTAWFIVAIIAAALLCCPSLAVLAMLPAAVRASPRVGAFLCVRGAKGRKVH